MSQMQQPSKTPEEAGYEPDGPPDELDALLKKGIDLGPTPVVEALTRAEVNIQMAQAMKRPRSLKDFYDRALAMATLNERVAASCMYALPRGKNEDGSNKVITGPSIRLAEIIASAWQNLRVEARIVEILEDAVVTRGSCLDLEANNGQAVEVRKSIIGKKGRFNNDMIGVAAMSALSLARRNAIFAVIPRAFIEPIMDAARKVAVGDEKTLSARRDAMMAYFMQLGLTPERVFAAVGVRGVQDISLDNLAVLKGFATAIKTGEATLESIFPTPQSNTAPNSAAAIAALKTTNTPQQGATAAGASPTPDPNAPKAAGEMPSAAATSPPAASSPEEADEFTRSLAAPPVASVGAPEAKTPPKTAGTSRSRVKENPGFMDD